MLKPLLIVGLLFSPSLVYGQPNTPCSNSNYNNVVANSTGSAIYMCGTGNTWVNITPSSGSIPAGTITLNLTSCPTGFTEATELNGKTLVGTLAANGNVGTTGGNDNITPTGSVTAPTFTGNAITFTEIINHTHTVTSVGSAATGSTTNLTGASDTSSTTATTANPSGGVASFQKTPSGTISAPTFNGVQFDNRSAFIRVIFCRKS